MKVKAPKNIGYISDIKEQYRNEVWSSFSKDIIKITSEENNFYALIFPSKEGLEIQTAINFGIPEHKIICIDKNPALIAVSEWRKTYPLVKFYGCELSDLHEKLIKNQQIISIANLDLCYNFSRDLIKQTSRFLSKTTFSYPCNIAVTIAKGRESTETNYLLDLVSEKIKYSGINDKRMRCFCHIALDSGYSNKFYAVFLLNQNNYIHSRVPMTWASFELHNVSSFSKSSDCELKKQLIEAATEFVSHDDIRYSKDLHKSKWYEKFYELRIKFNELNYIFKKEIKDSVTGNVYSYEAIFGKEYGSIISSACNIPTRRI